VSALEDGRSVGRYRIIRFLGAGAMGEVYLAEDPHIERKLAIKTVRLAGGRPQDIEDRKRRLLREARAAGRLLHPNVVTLFDTGEHEGLLYLAFEFVEGRDLATRIEEGPPPTLGEVLRIVRQAADALDYAHRQGIVHRDIKPSNILLDTTGKVKVADFGIAKVAGQNTELTVVGSVMGSPQYLSPEQIRGEELDGRSDIFSLGVVLYELLSGRRPFDGETITTLVYQILHKDPSISELRSVPLRLDQLLHRMLAKDREQRVATAELVAEELAAIGRELPPAVLAAPAAAATQELDATRILPPRTAPPAAAAGAGTEPAFAAPPGGGAGTVAASQASAQAPAMAPGPLEPPGPSPVSSALSGVGALPGTAGTVGPPGTPGTPASLASASSSPPSPAPAVAAAAGVPGAGAVSAPVRRRGAGIWIGVAALLLVLAAGFFGTAYWAWQRFVQPAMAGREAAGNASSTSSTSSTAASEGREPSPVQPSPGGSSPVGSSPGALSTGAPSGTASSAGAPTPSGASAPPGPATGALRSAGSTGGTSSPVGPAASGATPSRSSIAGTAGTTASKSPAGEPSPSRARSAAVPSAAVPSAPATVPSKSRPASGASGSSPSPAAVAAGAPVRGAELATPPAPVAARGRSPRTIEETTAKNGAGAGSAVAADRHGESGGEREPAVPAAPAADQVLQSGLQLAFRISPADAFVLLDGTVVGRADEWSGDKKARPYTLPGPGSYLIKIKRDGMRDYRVAVEASATRGVTQLTARLQPLPAAQVETSDLRTYRVRDAIALHVQPENALVLVDGQTRGMARQFAGRFGRPGEWLTLEPGKHRVTVTAPGYRREDIAVEVYAGADRDREKVDVVLKPGAGGE
jgi:tRNA A-37 threonylcarbamoyl transferase component Bud32